MGETGFARIASSARGAGLDVPTTSALAGPCPSATCWTCCSPAPAYQFVSGSTPLGTAPTTRRSCSAIPAAFEKSWGGLPRFPSSGPSTICSSIGGGGGIKGKGRREKEEGKRRKAEGKGQRQKAEG